MPSAETVFSVIEKSGWDLPVVLKSANLGSSIGVYLIKEMSQVQPALDELSELSKMDEPNAFPILLEKYMVGREIECSILELPKNAQDQDNENRYQCSLPGEIISADEIYDYKNKYLNDSTDLIIPADLPKKLVTQFQDLSIKVAEVLNLDGLARVDFFLSSLEDSKKEKIFVNEVNTMPGFTDISMYPKLLKLENIEIEEIIDRLVDLALSKRHT